jgi:tetratricopeptide (TPR) repeat protein
VQGKVLGERYEVLKFLGQGGFGDTYLVGDRFKPINSQCVVKQLKPKRNDPLTLEAAKKLFEREVQVLYQLGRHDRIPQLLDHFEENQQFYLVQEFVDGEDFTTEILTNGHLDEEKIVDLLQDVLETLQFVHANQVIHRDIKPSNLIRRQQDGKFVLIDFGAVKQISSQQIESSGVANLTIAIGTPGYMPLEQQGGKPRFSSDIYALGMTAIHGLTGMAPNLLQEDYRTGDIIWQPHAPAVSGRLGSVLTKMVKSYYKERYETVEDVLADLAQLKSQVSIPQQVAQHFSNLKLPASSLKLPAISALPIPRSPKAWYYLIPLAGVAIVAAIAIPRFLSGTDVTQNPSNPIATTNSTDELVKQGNILFHTGKFEEAITIYEKALNSNPTDPALVWRSRGLALSRLQKYNEAIASYERALAIKSNDDLALGSKGFALWKLGRREEAVTFYSQSLNIRPDNANTLNNRAAALIGLKRYDEALKDVDRSIGIDPKLADSWSLRGEIMLYGLKRYEEAAIAYDRSISIQPNHPNAWLHRGEALSRLKRYQEALFSYEEALKNKPDFPEAWLSKGITLSLQKKYNEAIASADTALKYRENYPDAWFAKGIWLAALGRYREAVAAYDKSLVLRPDDKVVQDARKKAAANL